MLLRLASVEEPWARASRLAAPRWRLRWAARPLRLELRPASGWRSAAPRPPRWPCARSPGASAIRSPPRPHRQRPLRSPTPAAHSGCCRRRTRRPVPRQQRECARGKQQDHEHGDGSHHQGLRPAWRCSGCARRDQVAACDRQRRAGRPPSPPAACCCGGRRGRAGGPQRGWMTALTLTALTSPVRPSGAHQQQRARPTPLRPARRPEPGPCSARRRRSSRRASA